MADNITDHSVSRYRLQDVRKPIIFVKETNNNKDNVHDREKSAKYSLEITGDDVKTFYESLVFSESEEVTLKMAKPFKCASVMESSQFDRRKDSKRKTTEQPPRLSQLFVHAQNGNLTELRKALESHRIDLDSQDMFGWTMLMVSAYAGHKAIVELLLTLGASGDGPRDSQGRSAAELAQLAGQTDIVELLKGNKKLGKFSNCVNCDQLTSSVVQDESKSLESKLSECCYVCGMEISHSMLKNHCYSTLHQFNRQYKPAVNHYCIPQHNQGYKLLIKNGWDPQGGLGSDAKGRIFPVKTVLKRDRLGLGSESGADNKKARVTHFGPADLSAVQHPSRPPAKPTEPAHKKTMSQRKAKERQWEINMRRYMNTDDNVLSCPKI